jgi:hypothetical protein
MVHRLTLLVVFGCCALLTACTRPQKPALEDPGSMSKAQEQKLRKRIEAAIADSQHNPSSDSTRVRSVCTFCGGWKESSTTNIITAFMEGAQPNSVEAKQIAEAKQLETPFIVRHVEQCGKKGAIIKAVYPDEPGWSKLDPKKREE